MGMQVLSAKNPQWADAEKLRILIDVEFAHIGTMRFMASPVDPEPHGRQLFERATVDLEFGSVADYVPPAAPIKTRKK